MNKEEINEMHFMQKICRMFNLYYKTSFGKNIISQKWNDEINAKVTTALPSHGFIVMLRPNGVSIIKKGIEYSGKTMKDVMMKYFNNMEKK